jgi:hypothetical protein
MMPTAKIAATRAVGQGVAVIWAQVLPALVFASVESSVIYWRQFMKKITQAGSKSKGDDLSQSALKQFRSIFGSLAMSDIGWYKTPLFTVFTCQFLFNATKRQIACI